MSNGTSIYDKALDLAGIDDASLRELVEEMENDNASLWDISRVIREYKNKKDDSVDTEQPTVDSTELPKPEDVIGFQPTGPYSPKAIEKGMIEEEEKNKVEKKVKGIIEMACAENFPKGKQEEMYLLEC